MRCNWQQICNRGQNAHDGYLPINAFNAGIAFYEAAVFSVLK